MKFVFNLTDIAVIIVKIMMNNRLLGRL